MNSKTLELRALLLASAVCVAVPGMAQAQAVGAQAQAEGNQADSVDSPDASDDPEADSGEDIVVTGSRIKQNPSDQVRPVTTFGTEAIVERGLLNVADAINNLPLVFTPESQRGGQSANIGRNYVNLFGLGSERTLTVINGRRFVSTNPGSSTTAAPGNQVDLNNIPVLLIDRTDIVPATGAATYGSDAIAGVVNIILKNDFEGLILDAQSGISSRGDYFNYSLRGLAGVSFNEGRGNVTVSFERSSNDGLLSTERKLSSCVSALNLLPPGVSNTSTDGIPANVLTCNTRAPELTNDGVPFRSQAPVNGPFARGASFVNNIPVIADPSRPGQFVPARFDRSGNLVPYNVGDIRTIAISVGGDGYNLLESAAIYTPVTRDVVYATGRYDLTDNIKITSELMSSWVKGSELAEQSGNLNSPLLFSSAPASGGIPLLTSNAFLSPQARAILEGQGLTSFVLGRTNNDIHNSRIDARSHTMRGVLAVDADFQIGNRDFYANAAFNYGHSSGNNRSVAIIQQRFANAADAVFAPGLDAARAPGGIACRVTRDNPNSTDPLITGCRPLNLFGFGAPSDEAIDYVTAEVRQDYDLYQTNFQANVGGETIKLPAGMVKFAAGYEYRKERSKFVSNDIARDGLSRNLPVLDVFGSYHTNEVYGEISIPLVGEDFTLPLVQALTLQMSGRIIDNSQAGRDEAWNIGGRWEVIDGLTIRGSKSRTFRGPSIVELFQPRTSRLQSVQDPCASNRINAGRNVEARRRNCDALFASLGLPLPTVVPFTSIGQTVGPFQTLGGNPDLKNETADSWTIGAALQPGFLPGLSFTADYINIKINGGISTFTANNILSTCFDADDPDPAVCGLVTRDAGAQITRVTTGYVNSSFNKFEAMSYSLKYRMRFNENQGLNFSLDAINNLRRESSFSGFDYDLNRSDGTTGAPRWKAQLRLSYIHGPAQINWSTNYISSALLSRTATIEDQDVLRIGDYFRHDVSAQIEIAKQFTFRLGVNNVFDRQPDPLSGGAYDILGRSFYAGARVSF